MKNNTLIIIAIILAMLLILVGTILTTSVKTKKVKVKCYDNHNNEIKGATCIKEVPLNNHICVVFNQTKELTTKISLIHPNLFPNLLLGSLLILFFYLYYHLWDSFSELTDEKADGYSGEI